MHLGGDDDRPGRSVGSMTPQTAPGEAVERLGVINTLRRTGWTYRAIGLVLELSDRRVAAIDHAQPGAGVARLGKRWA